jgi:hypothetical protein
MVARTAAAALGDLMDFKPSLREQKLLAFLYDAILILSQSSAADVTITTLADFIGKADSSFVGAAGGIDRKLFSKLAADLQALTLIRGSLLAADGRQLDVGALLGAASPTPTGKTPLNIICPKFLGETSAVEFWLAQFLAAADCWVSQHPSDHLQAVLLLDDADLCLPAARRPATRLPLESLLKRAPSAGLGIFLTTRSPEDLDHKRRDDIGTWFLGRIEQDMVPEELKPLFDARGDLVARLACLETGEFTLLRDGQPQCFRTDPPAVEPRPLTDDEILDRAAISRARS